MNKDHICQRLGEQPMRMGQSIRYQSFQTGYRYSQRRLVWYPLTKWSSAIQEAGREPNRFSLPAFGEEWLFRKVIDYIRELGHFPTRLN